MVEKTKKVIFRKDILGIYNENSGPGLTNEMKHLFDGVTIREVLDCKYDEWYFYIYSGGCANYTIGRQFYRGWYIDKIWIIEVEEFKDIAGLFEL